MNLNSVRYEDLDKSFKTLLKSRISENPETIKQNTLRIIAAYNGYVYELEYLNKKTTNPLDLHQIDNGLKYIGKKLQRVFSIINYDYKVKHNFQPINFNYFINHNYTNIKMPLEPNPNAFDMQIFAQILQSMSRTEQAR